MGAQCPAELPILPQTHTCPQQTGMWFMVVQVCLVTPVLFWGHSTVPVAPDSSHSSLDMLGPAPQLELSCLLQWSALISPCHLAPVLHFLPHSLHRSTRLLQLPCAQRSPFSQETGQGVLSGGSRGE